VKFLALQESMHAQQESNSKPKEDEELNDSFSELNDTASSIAVDEDLPIVEESELISNNTNSTLTTDLLSVSLHSW
jgi:hypothetical protein